MEVTEEATREATVLQEGAMGLPEVDTALQEADTVLMGVVTVLQEAGTALQEEVTVVHHQEVVQEAGFPEENRVIAHMADLVLQTLEGLLNHTVKID